MKNRNRMLHIHPYDLSHSKKNLVPYLGMKSKNTYMKLA